MLSSYIGLAILTWLGLAVGGFLYEALVGKRDWGTLLRDSFFQGVAIGTYAALLHAFGLVR